MLTTKLITKPRNATATPISSAPWEVRALSEEQLPQVLGDFSEASQHIPTPLAPRCPLCVALPCGR